MRNDILIIELHEALINTILIPNETETTYQVASKEVKVGYLLQFLSFSLFTYLYSYHYFFQCLYQQEVGQEAFVFLHSTAQDEGDSVNMADGAGNYDVPRITLTLR